MYVHRDDVASHNNVRCRNNRASMNSQCLSSSKCLLYGLELEQEGQYIQKGACHETET